MIAEKRIQAFWKKVRKTRGCWVWTGAVFRYGFFNLRPLEQYAHRVAWILAYGLIPEGMSVLHKCDNPVCVRPSHLFLGTQDTNMKDMKAKGRSTFCENHAMAKLTSSQVRAIRASSTASPVLAEFYGITARHIRDIRAKKCWKALL